MSASDHLSPDQFPWFKTTDRYGGRAEVANTEHGPYVIDGTGYGRMKWTVEYPDHDYGMTPTKRLAREWAAEDYRERSKTNER